MKPAKRAAIVGERYTAIEDPAVLTIVPSQPVLHLERSPAMEVIQVVIDASLQVLGVNTFSPPIAHLLRHWSACEGEPAGIRPAGPPWHQRTAAASARRANVEEVEEGLRVAVNYG